MNKISAVYKIMNTVTGDFYIGSSIDVKRRWREHKRPSTWKKKPNSPMYQDMQKYGVDKFRFQILCPVMTDYLTQVEQELIDMIQPAYNKNKAKVMESYKKYMKEYRKEYYKEYMKEYFSQLCFYNDKTLTLGALTQRLKKQGIKHPYREAKKYLLNQQ